MTQPKVEVKPIEQGATPDPMNVNKHTQRGGGLLENSLRKRGAFRSIASAGKGVETPVVMAGNFTLEKAIDAGFTEIVNVHVTGNQIVNVVRDDIAPNSAEAIALGLEDNEIGKQSYNPDIDMLAQLAAGDNALLSVLKKEDKIFGGMLEGMGIKAKEPVDAEPQTDRAGELAEKWQTASGQLWKLGDHRLLIGDCTVRENVERLMGGERAGIMVTDPPYGVEYESEKGEVTNDDRFDWTQAYELFSGDVVYVWHGERTSLDVGLNIRNCGFEIRSRIIWVKPSLTMGRGHYHFQHEGAWYGVRKGKKSEWSGDHSQSTVWNIDREDEAHPTVKPVECMQRPMKNHSFQVVYDPFCGSGTTIIAAHNLNRRCFAMEISEKYGAVILQRFLDATGIQPELLDTPK